MPSGKGIRIDAVRFHGIGDYLNDVRQKVELYIRQGQANFIFGLVDLYGLPSEELGLSNCGSVAERFKSARAQIRKLIPTECASQFRQHFAVHEVEAWLLAYPEAFPKDVRNRLPKRDPETVNLNDHPSKLLRRLMGGRYKKTVFAYSVLSKVDPQQAIYKCPYLKLFVDDLLQVARLLQ